MRDQNENFEGIPGVESEQILGSQKVSLLFSILTSLILFGLLLSESIRSEEWEVRGRCESFHSSTTTENTNGKNR